MSEERFDNIGDIYDRLAQDARIQPLKDELMDIRTTEQLAEAREFIKRAIHDQHVTQSMLARRTGIKPTAISQFLTDKWVGKVGTLYTHASTLARAVNTILRQRQAEETSVGGFVRNGFADQVGNIAQLVLKRKIIGAITAPAGSGKTMSLRALNDDIAGSVLLTAGKTRASISPFLNYWALSLGLTPGGRSDAVQERITNCLIGSDRMMLIDEAHKLIVPTLDVIREVHDETGCPILFAATPTFRQIVMSQRVGHANRELLDQLYSRIAMFCDLTEQAGNAGDPGRLHTIADIRAVFARGRIRLSRDAGEFLMRTANTFGSGGLRRCRHLVQIVVDLYPDEEVTAALLREALALAVGPREAGFVSTLVRADTGDREPVAAAG